MDDTALVQSYIDSGNLLPPGTYAVGELVLSARSQLIGAGAGRTVLISSQPNSRIIRANPGTVGARVGAFTVRAHPLGSAGEAILLAGMSHGDLFDLEYESNGGNYASFLRLCSSFNGAFMGCYGNTIHRYRVQSQTGPATVIQFDNDGAGVYRNANCNRIEDGWVYSCSGIQTIIDARRSALTTIVGGLFEANTGATAIIPGTMTEVSGVWFESLASAITPAAGLDGASNSVLIHGNYFSGEITVTITSEFANWAVYDNAGLTVVNQGTNNYIRNLGATVGG